MSALCWTAAPRGLEMGGGSVPSEESFGLSLPSREEAKSEVIGMDEKVLLFGLPVTSICGACSVDAPDAIAGGMFSQHE